MPANCRMIFAAANPSSSPVAPTPVLAVRQALPDFASLATNSIAEVSLIKVRDALPVANTAPAWPASGGAPIFQAADRAAHRARKSGRDNNCALDAVDVGKILIEVRLSKCGNRSLIGFLSVSAVQILHHVHPGSHFPKRSESLRIEKSIAPIVDEQLRRAGIWPSGRKRHVARLVALRHWIILNPCRLPFLAHNRIGAQSELDHETGNHAEEGGISKESVLHQIVESVRSQRSPRARHVDDEIAFRGGEFRIERSGCFCIQRCWMHQTGISHMSCP